MDMLAGTESINFSRKPEIMADAVYAVLCKDSKSITGQFLIDEDILKNEGVNDFTDYACNPGNITVFTFLDNKTFFFIFSFLSPWSLYLCSLSFFFTLF